MDWGGPGVILSRSPSPRQVGTEWHPQPLSEQTELACQHHPGSSPCGPGLRGWPGPARPGSKRGSLRCASSSSASLQFGGVSVLMLAWAGPASAECAQPPSGVHYGQGAGLTPSGTGQPWPPSCSPRPTSSPAQLAALPPSSAPASPPAFLVPNRHWGWGVTHQTGARLQSPGRPDYSSRVQSWG